VPTALFLELWLGILREAAMTAALDADTTEALLAAVAHAPQAWRVPALMDADAFVALGQALTDATLAAIATHVPAALQYGYREAASELCRQESQRWLASEERGDASTL
jgi:hypothetical protein